MLTLKYILSCIQCTVWLILFKIPPPQKDGSEYVMVLSLSVNLKVLSKPAEGFSLNVTQWQKKWSIALFV